jgi:putative PIN family toxin of toxin-antitoxin system
LLPRVVLDTNILVSAMLSINGNSAKIVNMVFDNEVEVYYSGGIITEYEDVLSRPKFNFNQNLVHIIISAIQDKGVLTDPATSRIAFTDESDRIFYDTTKTCKAVLITGNIRHFPKEPFIVSPQGFLANPIFFMP